MRIGFDVDGVLADFNTAYINRVIQTSGRDLFPPRPFDIPCWDYPQFYGYSDEEAGYPGGAVWKDIVQDERFWVELPGYPETRQALAGINILQRQGHDIYFVTSRPGRTAKRQTEDWLLYVAPDLLEPRTVLISSAKGAVAAALQLDVYVDDNYDNVDSVHQLSPSTTTYLLDRPWTAGRTPAGVTRLENLLHILPTVAVQ